VFWGDPKGQHIIAADLTQDDGKHSVMVCLGDDLDTQRCYRDDGAVFDQQHDRKIEIWVTFSTVAAAWNERGKPLSDLKPRAPSPPTAASPSPPAATPSPPAAAAPSPPANEPVIPQLFSQAPANYDEFVADYNKALAFLRANEVQSNHKCWPVGADPSNPRHGWCQDLMVWSNSKGQHITAVDDIQDDGFHGIMVCEGDKTTHRCYRDDGSGFDQSFDPKINIWVTARRIAQPWNERGKPLADLTPRGKSKTKR
jgi:hypothetical protein